MFLCWRVYENTKIHVVVWPFTHIRCRTEFGTFSELPCLTCKGHDGESSHTRRASEKTKKRMKMADLKAFVETKILSKSEKALEKIGQEEHKMIFEPVILNLFYRTLTRARTRTEEEYTFIAFSYIRNVTGALIRVTTT